MQKTRNVKSQSTAPELANRLDLAKKLSDTPTVSVTLRIPRGLNDWLQEYSHLSYPETLGKGQLVAEAIRMLVCKRGRAKAANYEVTYTAPKESRKR